MDSVHIPIPPDQSPNVNAIRALAELLERYPQLADLFRPRPTRKPRPFKVPVFLRPDEADRLLGTLAAEIDQASTAGQRWRRIRYWLMVAVGLSVGPRV